MELLLENYRRCCERRLRLWVSPEIEVHKSGPLGFSADYGVGHLHFTFYPRQCCWELVSNGTLVKGSFDLVTKQARRILTTSPGEEEAR